MTDHSHIIKTLSQTIKRLRDEKQITQKQLSQDSGLTVDYISKLERGDKKNPSFVTLFKLSSGLKITATQLMSEIEDNS